MGKRMKLMIKNSSDVSTICKIDPFFRQTFALTFPLVNFILYFDWKKNIL